MIRSHRQTARPQLESLEGRAVPALVGLEFPVNTLTAGGQWTPANASSRNGMSVAVWGSQVGNEYDIRGRLYNAAGVPVGADFAVANVPGLRENEPAVSMDGQGNFVVAYTRGVPGLGSDVVFQCFNSFGGRVGGVTVVRPSLSAQFDPSVAMGETGRFIVTLTRRTGGNNDLAGQMFFFGNGAPMAVLNLPATLGGNESQSSAAMAIDGRFAVAWMESSPRTGLQNDVFLNRFAANSLLVAQHRLSFGPQSDAAPTAAMDVHANAVVAWQHQTAANNSDVQARRVSSVGVPSFLIYVASSPSNEWGPSAALHNFNGRFVVSYGVGNRTEVAEVSAFNFVQARHNLGANNFPSGVSVNGSGRYFVTYASPRGLFVPNWDVFGRFGVI